jgi:hydroxymethylbilane synthase
MPEQPVIATRQSRLALWQAEHVRALMREHCALDARLLGMTTRGDEILDRTLSKVGGKGLFVKELETALEERRADLAVHSLKDVPMDLPDGFKLAAVLEREDPRDAFVSSRFASVAELPPAACVGTSSLRRVVQFEPLRGNLDTRLRKLDEGHYDAIVLAAAGLVRLQLGARIAQRFEFEQMLPAAGQGALAIEVRSADERLSATLAALNHPPTWLAAHAERAVSRALGGSCTVPLAALAIWQGDTLLLRAALGNADAPTKPLLRAQTQGQPRDAAAASALGEQAAASLRKQGADAYLA